MIHLMLYSNTQKFIGFKCLFFSVSVMKGDCYLLAALDIFIETRYAQAAFLVDDTAFLV